MRKCHDASVMAFVISIFILLLDVLIDLTQAAARGTVLAAPWGKPRGKKVSEPVRVLYNFCWLKSIGI